MSFPRDVNRFPPQYRAIFDLVIREGSVSIPSENPRKLQAYLWAYQRALRANGNPDLADSVQVSADSASITISLRSASREAQEIEAALKAFSKEDGSPSPSPDTLFDRLSGK